MHHKHAGLGQVRLAASGRRAKDRGPGGTSSCSGILASQADTQRRLVAGNRAGTRLLAVGELLLSVPQMALSHLG